MNEELIVESKNFNYYLYKNLQTQDDDLRIIKDNRFLDILRMVDYSICNIEIDDEKPFRKTKVVRKMKNGKYFSRELGMDSGGVGEFLHGQFNFLGLYMRIKQFLQMKWIGLSILFWLRELLHLLMETSTGDSSFSSHNILHLDLKNYMKEQIYFVTKNQDTLNSELYSLADFPEIRYETTKIYEFYMKGILGGTAFE